MTRAQRLGVRIVKARRYRGLSQSDLAARVGVSQPTVSRWETGGKAPERVELAAVARVLGVPVRALLGKA